MEIEPIIKSKERQMQELKDIADRKLTIALGADHGGIPELIRPGETGELFKARNARDLAEKIRHLWNDRELLEKYTSNCRYLDFDTVDTYCEKLMKYYR